MTDYETQTRVYNMTRDLNDHGNPLEPWCYWCDRPQSDCSCHLDPAGIPPGHWSAPPRLYPLEKGHL